MPRTVHELRRILLGRPAYTLGRLVVIDIKLALAEIRQLDLPIRVDEHVLGLQVPLDDVERVQLADHDHHLRDLEHGHVFVQAFVLRARDVEEEFAARALVHHEADLLGGDEAVVQGYYEFVSYFFEEFAFVFSPLNLLHAFDGFLF